MNPMQYETILYAVDEGIATLTLNRPAKRNALDLVMRREIASAVQAASRDDEVRVLIVTGAGGNFCSGGDIATMQTRKPGADAGRQRMRDNWDWTQELMYLGKPVIAAVDGGAVGAGFSIALAADFILASAFHSEKSALCRIWVACTCCPASSACKPRRKSFFPRGTCPSPKPRRWASSTASCRPSR